jgi:hypothetical protein
MGAYTSLYRESYACRFTLCAALRRAAYSPLVGSRLIALLSEHRKLAEAVARFTRR